MDDNIHAAHAPAHPPRLLAECLIRDGYAGMQVRSFAKGATDVDLNIVLWAWGSEPPVQLALVDEEGRLD